MHARELTSNKQRITSEHHPLLPILHEIANAILRMARGMQSFHGDALADLERFVVRGSLRDRLAAFSSDDGEFAEFVELLVHHISIHPGGCLG